MLPNPTPGLVYEALAEHQTTADWDMQGLMKELHRWKEIFVSEFKLELPPVAFCIKHTRALCFGYFRPGHNEFGMTREICINRTYLNTREHWQVLGTELHELLHAWQDKRKTAGKRNYHNIEFREKAREFGLIVDSRGATEYAPEAESPFLQVLRKHGLKVPELPTPVTHVVAGSKQKKWSCVCTPPVNVRVAVARFKAMCLHCNQMFVRQD